MATSHGVSTRTESASYVQFERGFVLRMSIPENQEYLIDRSRADFALYSFLFVFVTSSEGLRLGSMLSCHIGWITNNVLQSSDLALSLHKRDVPDEWDGVSGLMACRARVVLIQLAFGHGHLRLPVRDSRNLAAGSCFRPCKSRYGSPLGLASRWLRSTILFTL